MSLGNVCSYATRYIGKYRLSEPYVHFLNALRCKWQLSMFGTIHYSNKANNVLTTKDVPIMSQLLSAIWYNCICCWTHPSPVYLTLKTTWPHICDNLRWFIGDFTLTPQIFWIEFVSKLSRQSLSPSTDHKFESSLSLNCHYSHFHRLPTISLNRVCH